MRNRPFVHGHSDYKLSDLQICSVWYAQNEAISPRAADCGRLVYRHFHAFGCSRFPLFASLGYPVSFAAGLIFRQDYADPTGAMTLSSMWIIFLTVYLVIMCIGIGVEAIARKKRKGWGRLPFVWKEGLCMNKPAIFILTLACALALVGCSPNKETKIYRTICHLRKLPMSI